MEEYERERQILEHEFGFELVEETNNRIVMQKNRYRLFMFKNDVIQITKKTPVDTEGRLKFYGTNYIQDIQFITMLFIAVGIIRENPVILN